MNDMNKIIERAEDAVFADCERDDWSAYKLSRPLFVAWAVIQGQGVTDNGGFAYFFENDWPDNPSYSVFVEAFREIGAFETADCFEKAMNLFPFENPHRILKSDALIWRGVARIN